MLDVRNALSKGIKKTVFSTVSNCQIFKTKITSYLKI